MQVDRYFRHSWTRVVGIQVVIETHNDWLTVLFQNGRPLYQPIKAPYIALGQIGVECDFGRLGVYRILLLRQKLIPTLMIGTRGFTGGNVG